MGKPNRTEVEIIGGESFPAEKVVNGVHYGLLCLALGVLAISAIVIAVVVANMPC